MQPVLGYIAPEPRDGTSIKDTKQRVEVVARTPTLDDTTPSPSPLDYHGSFDWTNQAHLAPQMDGLAEADVDLLTMPAYEPYGPLAFYQHRDHSPPSEGQLVTKD